MTWEDIMSMNEQIRLLVSSGANVLSLESTPITQDEDWLRQFTVTRRRFHEGDLAALLCPIHGQTTRDTIGDLVGEPYSAICMRDYGLAGARPIDLLTFLHGSLERGGHFFCSGSADGRGVTQWSARDCFEFFLTIARRCGFTVLDSQMAEVGEAPGHFSLVLRRDWVAPRWGLFHLREEDLPGFVTLFRDSFDSDISIDLWRWKYGAGRGQAIVAKRGERLVAHYGGTIRAVSYFGEPGQAIQICDVMVDPRERAVMTKKGAMFMTTATFFETYLGLGGSTLVYGFPTRRHMQLGEKLGLYGEVARMVEVRWPAANHRPRLRTRLSFLDGDDPKQGEEVDALWARMRRDLGEAVVVVRDSDYLNYRYFSHPTIAYDVVCVRARLSGKALGIMVLRREQDSCELVDIVAPLSRLPWIIDQARRMAGRWGFETLHCWATQHQAHRFVCGVGTVTPLDVSVATSVWLKGQSPGHLIDKWWLMSGDTEFR
jgi:hypothetical protein